MSEQPPSRDQWLHLYEQANALKMAHPWEWLLDSDIFGVQNPLNEEVGYCSIMGNLGQAFGMIVFLGPEGLAEYARLYSGEVVPESFEAVATLQGLSVTFEDRQMMSKRDLDVVRSLGLRFRGSNQWPWFRSHRRGYAPWYLTQDEAAFLSLALEQALEVAQRARDDPRTLEPPREGLILVRAPEGEGAERVWRDKWEPVVQAYSTPQPPKPVDELRLRRLLQNARGRAKTWELDIFLFPARGGERGERPYYPRCIMCVDSDSGIILDTYMQEPWLPLDKLRERLLNLIENVGVIPSRIDVASEEAYLVAESLAKGLDIRVRQRERLPSLDAAREAIFQFMR